MRLFIDSANINQIKEMNDTGVISGVTTNPTLIAREGRDLFQVLREIAAIVDGPISAEVISSDTSGMVSEAHELAAIHPNIVIKIPVTYEGLKAIKMLRQSGIRTNATLVFSANQGLLAALAGATYVSPFIGRLDDTGYDGLALLQEIVQMYSRYQLKTEVIAASIRHPLHVTGAARIGAHIATVPFQVLRQLVKHPLTDQGIARFQADWEAARSAAGK